MDAAAFKSTLSRQADASFLLARRQWRRMGSLEDWPVIVASLTSAVAAGQEGAARVADRYVSSLDVGGVADLNPGGFAGTASDGRPLDSLLYSAVVHARESSAKEAEALLAGEKWLEMLVTTQIADAGRAAASAGMVVRPRTGYVRQVNVPCCKRCAVLAGKWFRWNHGFLRHPGCRCTHRVVTQSDARGMSSDIRPEQIRDLSVAQRQAVADGADLNQVINADRGRLSGMLTAEGTSRRGWASYVRRSVDQQRGVQTVEAVQRARRGTRNVTVTRPRVTPEAIYRLASSREEAVRLLAANGYIVGDLRDVARLAL